MSIVPLFECVPHHAHIMVLLSYPISKVRQVHYSICETFSIHGTLMGCLNTFLKNRISWGADCWIRYWLLWSTADEDADSIAEGSCLQEEEEGLVELLDIVSELCWSPLYIPAGYLSISLR